MDVADLVTRLCRALDLSERVLIHLLPDGYTDTVTPELSVPPQKAVSETGMLLLAASGARRFPEVRERIDHLISLIEPYARADENLLNIALRPGRLVEFGSAHVFLSRLGSIDPEFDHMLRLAYASSSRLGDERPPFATLEQKWIESLWRNDGEPRRWRQLLGESVMCNPIDVLTGAREDIYAFTHLAMYLTDFGLRAARFPRKRSTILAEAESYLARCIVTGDHDLAGELLLLWPYMRAPWSPAATFALRWLTHLEDRSGLLPGGTTRPERLHALEGPDRMRYALGTAYHTAYVMGLLCSAALQPGRCPPANIHGPQASPAFIEEVLQTLEPDSGHWRDVFAQLDRSEQGALGTLLLDIAIIQKHKKNDFKAINELIALGTRHRIPETPLRSQSVELLQRLGVCTQIIQARWKRIGENAA
jgi:hypothetical protein